MEPYRVVEEDGNSKDGANNVVEDLVRKVINHVRLCKAIGEIQSRCKKHYRMSPVMGRLKLKDTCKGVEDHVAEETNNRVEGEGDEGHHNDDKVHA